VATAAAGEGEQEGETEGGVDNTIAAAAAAAEEVEANPFGNSNRPKTYYAPPE